MRNSSKGLSLGGVSIMPLYRIEPQFCEDSVDGSSWWGAFGFSGFGGVGVSSLSVLASLGGVNSVVTFFLRGRGGFLMRVNLSVSVVATSSLNTSLEVVLFVLADGFVLLLVEVTLLLL